MESKFFTSCFAATDRMEELDGFFADRGIPDGR